MPWAGSLDGNNENVNKNLSLMGQDKRRYESVLEGNMGDLHYEIIHRGGIMKTDSLVSCCLQAISPKAHQEGIRTSNGTASTQKISKLGFFLVIPSFAFVALSSRHILSKGRVSTRYDFEFSAIAFTFSKVWARRLLTPARYFVWAKWDIPSRTECMTGLSNENKRTVGKDQQKRKLKRADFALQVLVFLQQEVKAATSNITNLQVPMPLASNLNQSPVYFVLAC